MAAPKITVGRGRGGKFKIRSAQTVFAADYCGTDLSCFGRLNPFPYTQYTSIITAAQLIQKKKSVLVKNKFAVE